MPTKNTIIEFIQTVADDTDDNTARISFGTPGSNIEDASGKIRPTGLAWDETDGPSSFGMVTEGIAKAIGYRVTTSTDYEMGITDGIIGVTAIPGGGITIDLYNALNYGSSRILIIKDESGTAGTNNITVDPAGIQTIDGASSATISTNYGSLRLYCTGTKWMTF